MPFFQTLQQASFNGIKFPIRECTVAGGIRDHDHEYPHAPGSAAEKMGRKSYVIQMAGLFYKNFPKYPNLYPEALDSLRDAMEQELSADLVIPTIGTITAYARNWTQRASSKALSGEEVELVFIEDQSQLFLTTNLIDAGQSTLASKVAAFNAQAALEDFQSPKTIDLLSSLQTAANDVLSLQDTTEAIGNTMAVKLQQLQADCDAFDRSTEMLEPQHSALVELLHDAWDATRALNQSMASGQPQPKTYLVRATCSVAQASTEIFGDTIHATDLMSLNPIIDPFAIPANTTLLYYPATTGS